MGHIQWPKALMQLPEYQAMPGSSRKALDALAAQYNGHNNGDLSLTIKTSPEWGIKGKDTLAKALRDLQKRDLIRKTRTHIKTRSGARCALYALSWLPVDECKGKDLDDGAHQRKPRRLA
jgi:hypothetical protein